jgi:uncharacterized protein (UPF0332 family)
MLSREAEQRVRQHLRLAKGLLETTVLRPESTEFEERNSLSRAYYAIFHAFGGLLLSLGMEPSKSHGGLNKQIGRRLGSNFAQFMTDMYELRRFADYDPAWMLVRYLNEAKLKTASANVAWACDEAEKKLT